MCNKIAQIIPQPEAKQVRKRERDLDTPQVLGGNMPQDVVDRIALLQEALNSFPAVQSFGIGAMGLKGPDPENTPIRTGHNPVIDPIPQPAADIFFCRNIGGLGDPGENTTDIDTVLDIQVFEYFCDTPGIGNDFTIQLIIIQTKEKLGAGFYKLGPV